MRILTRQQSRQVDEVAIRDFGIPGIVLMENAGRGIADAMCDREIEGPVEICCGKGNNGGDGFVLARHLEQRGLNVHVYCCALPDALSDDAKTNHDILLQSNVPIEYIQPDHGNWAALDRAFEAADWVVDALLGTGATGHVRPPFDNLISSMNDAKHTKRLAIDVPSGLDCDTGEVSRPTFRATLTCTLVAGKPALVLEQCKSLVGELQVIDIGIPPKLLQMFDE